MNSHILPPLPGADPRARDPSRASTKKNLNSSPQLQDILICVRGVADAETYLSKLL